MTTPLSIAQVSYQLHMLIGLLAPSDRRDAVLSKMEELRLLVQAQDDLPSSKPEIVIHMINRRRAYGAIEGRLQGYSGAAWGKATSRFSPEYGCHFVELTLEEYEACREDVFKAAHLSARVWEPKVVVKRSDVGGQRSDESAKLHTDASRRSISDPDLATLLQLLEEFNSARDTYWATEKGTAAEAEAKAAQQKAFERLQAVFLWELDDLTALEQKVTNVSKAPDVDTFLQLLEEYAVARERYLAAEKNTPAKSEAHVSARAAFERLHAEVFGGDLSAARPNAPLKVEVVNGRLVASIGIETLEWASKPENGGPLERCAVDETRREEWAKDVVRELTREDELGETPISALLDEMMEKAADNGSGALIFPKKKAEKAMDELHKPDTYPTKDIVAVAQFLKGDGPGETPATTAGTAVLPTEEPPTGPLTSDLGPLNSPTPVDDKTPFAKLQKIAKEEGAPWQGVKNSAALLKAITTHREAMVDKAKALIAAKPQGGQA